MTERGCGRRVRWPAARLRSVGARCFTSLAILFALGAWGCDEQSPRVQTSHVLHEDLTHSPIPSEWVLEGAPRARAKDLAHAADEGLRAALWDCSAGKFRWYFNGDEFVHILEGSVTITDERGATRTLKPGDVADFEAGMHSIWQVDKYVKKLALMRDNKPPLLWRIRRKLVQLWKQGCENEGCADERGPVRVSSSV